MLKSNFASSYIPIITAVIKTRNKSVCISIACNVTFKESVRLLYEYYTQQKIRTYILEASNESCDERTKI